METLLKLAKNIDGAEQKLLMHTGKYVMPGGIDPHTHLDMPFNNTVTDDDWESGTIAAAFGGTTTILDFCLSAGETKLADAVDKWHDKGEGKAVIDYGFHLMIGDLTPETEAGITENFKARRDYFDQGVYGICEGIPSNRSYVISRRLKSVKETWRGCDGAL